MILFQVDKQTKIADLVLLTGIKLNNFWFEFFMTQFSQNIEVIENFESLITFLQPEGNRHKLIVNLKTEFDINGQSFNDMKIFVLNQSIFNNTDFTKIKSRKVKVMKVEING